MTIHHRTDSDGVEHQIWAQQQANSCGIASLWMLRCLASGQTISDSEWSMARSMFENVLLGTNLAPIPGPMTFTVTGDRSHQNIATMANAFGEGGLMTKHVIRKLISLGHTVISTARDTGHLTVDATKLSPTTPALVRVGWYSASGQRQGSHLIVAARKATNGTIVFLDPWEGRLRQKQNNGTYAGVGQIEEVIYIS